jgi:hypothetical protein
LSPPLIERRSTRERIPADDSWRRRRGGARRRSGSSYSRISYSRISYSSPPARTIEQQRDFIRKEVADQLIAAGRSPEEAQAAGAVIAARYETRAHRFGGGIGTAEERQPDPRPMVDRLREDRLRLIHVAPGIEHGGRP